MNASFIWHSQYNSCFLNYPLTVPSNLLEIVAETYQKDNQWPQLPRLPQLTHLFAHLEHFLADDRNWNSCLCSDAEVDTIERKLNAIAVHLQCEKQYAIECWKVDTRHCQSSVVHFLLLLKGMILGIIPDSCQTLMQANSTEKLVIEIFKLENFINEFLSQLKPIYDFMVGSNFQEEKILTKQFFKELNELVQQMPKINKKKLEKVPKLMEYLCLCHSMQEEGLRQKQQQGETTREIRKNNRNSQERLTVPYRSKSSTIEVAVWDIFRFNERIRKHSIYHPQKKLTMTSIESKTKPGSIEKDRPPSLERSETLFSAVKVKSQTVAESPNRDSLSRFNMRQRGMTAKSSNSKKGKSQKKTNVAKQEQIEQQRDLKAKKKKPVKIAIKMAALSQQVSLEKGKSRGWGIIREYLNKKIAERKLRKLLLF